MDASAFRVFLTLKHKSNLLSLSLRYFPHFQVIFTREREKECENFLFLSDSRLLREIEFGTEKAAEDLSEPSYLVFLSLLLSFETSNFLDFSDFRFKLEICVRIARGLVPLHSLLVCLSIFFPISSDL